MYNPQKCTIQSAERLVRWGVSLRDFNFAIHHIPGEENVWADLLTRWGAVMPCSIAVRRLRKVSPNNGQQPDEDPLANVRVQPLHDKKFVWPNVAEIADEQQKY